MLAYNLSPSFNWDAAKMTDEEIRTYTARLAQLGFCWQFITLAGFHVDGLGITSFARAYAKDKMLGYVQLVQRKERAEKVSTLTHQQWSGVEVVDRAIDLITGGTASTKATSGGFTETQFVPHDSGAVRTAPADTVGKQLGSKATEPCSAA
jgi:isocitrate lyase